MKKILLFLILLFAILWISKIFYDYYFKQNQITSQIFSYDKYLSNNWKITQDILYLYDYDWLWNIDFSKFNVKKLYICYSWKINKWVLINFKDFKWDVFWFMCNNFNWTLSINLDEEDVYNISKWIWKTLILPIDNLTQKWAEYISQMKIDWLELYVSQNDEKKFYNTIKSSKYIKTFNVPFQ